MVKLQYKHDIQGRKGSSYNRFLTAVASYLHPMCIKCHGQKCDVSSKCNVLDIHFGMMTSGRNIKSLRRGRKSSGLGS